MKLALRNLAIAAALTASGAMFAQDAPTPTVTLKWQTELGFASGDFRSGTGVNGKVYMSGGNIIKEIDATGIKEHSFSGVTFNKGMTADDAGNLIVLKGWATGAGTTNAFLISSDLSTIKDVTINTSTNAPYPLGRSDNQGRAVGDVFSEEGGAFFVYSQNQTHPACIMFKNGAFAGHQQVTTATGSVANTTAVAVPSVATMKQLTASSAPWDCFYQRSGNKIEYAENGVMNTLKEPAYPEGYAVTTQNGFDVFSLGGVTYQVRPMQRSGIIWGSDFIISDLSGENVIFHTSYADKFVSQNGKTGNGCNLVARKVSPYKVELYQIYTTTEASPVGFVAMYEITIPEPDPLYIAGGQMGWTVGDNATQFGFDADNNKYVYTDFKGGEFKIATDVSDWTVFDDNALFPTDLTAVGGKFVLEPNVAYSIGKTGAGALNYSVPEGDYTIEVSRDLKTLTISGEEKVEEQDVYIIGPFNGWTLPGTKLELDGSNYVYNNYTGGEFKLAVGEHTEWDNGGFNSNTYYPTEGTKVLEPNTPYAISKFGYDDGNISVPEGDYTIEISKNLKTLTVSGEEKFVAKQLYLIGEFNDWTTPGVAFEFDPEPVDGNVIYTLSVEQLSGEFLIAGEGYNPKYGGATFSNDGAELLTVGGLNNNCTTSLTNVTLTFTLPVDAGQQPMLQIASENAIAHDARKPYAHSMGAEFVEFGTYTFTFKATGASDEAQLILTDNLGNRYTKSLGAVEGGLNSVDVDLSDLNEGDYTWGISLKGTNDSTKPVKVAETALPHAATDYVGLTVIRDPEAEAFGYTVIGMSGQHGYMVFDPNGTLQYGGPIHAEWQANTFANGGSNTMFGGCYQGYAVFANWNDTAAGYWAVNPLDPNEEPYNMLASPGAQMANSGLWSLNGTPIGGGSTCIAFANLGEETFVVNFDEDYNYNGLTNDVYTRRIKTGDKYITVAPSFHIQYGNSFGGFAVSDKGYFAAQTRAAADNTGIYTVMRYYNFNNELLYSTAVSGNALITSCSSIACNADGSLMAMTTYNSNTHLYKVEYTEPETPQAVRGNGIARAVEGSQAVPTFTEIATIPTAYSGNMPRPDMDFDAAGNLHIADRKAQKYSVYAMPGETQSYTAAPAALALKLQTGIENVKFEAVDNSEVEYFTLQGIRMNPENLTPGLYIRRQGNKATKVIIK